ncbi:bifunctional (p)ppGpp synthetase/guanosine-3',5'-bis(diphosphate) 3'-pyrophosphohydrolase [Candidatus Woesearchaeota archaeon]|nr:bifunctional (p)ppGpp synthetase/guanosine-3',5'-bis(diphosphate) 3'-pyrophosphohydrolase [Candidatus Woesearchaeota archaeon]
MSKESLVEGMSKKSFLGFVKSFNPHADLKKVEEAYDFAKEAHKDQKRMSGKDHFDHLLNTSYILIKLRLDTETICAALLHDTLEDTETKKETIKKKFGDEILSLIEGVTKIRKIRLETVEEDRAENIREVLLATIKDIRVILIKLADRLHNMRTLKYLDEKDRKSISQETLEIYVPIAYKLGMYKLKSELEDLSLRYLEPEIYQELKSRIAKKKEQRDKEIRSIIEKAKAVMVEKKLDCRIYGRAKNFYSIYKKMKKKSIPFEEVRDLYAIRIIAKTQDDCYRALGAIHAAWTPISTKFDDYISTPKPNLYQSLHTEVLIDKKPVEVQIRTWDMHHVAEEGIAAHWRYKDTERDKKFDRRISWLKQILEWKTSKSAREFVEDLKIDLFKDEIYVLTPKGDPIPLPEKATPIDFAYAVHTDIGNHCARAKVNNAIVPLDHELKSGDVCEVITLKNAAPSRNWLKITKTNIAKSKIRQKLGIVADSDVKKEEEEVKEDLTAKIEGVKASNVKMSKCCTPKYGESIIGYRMKDGKVAIHLSACPNLKDLEDTRKVKLLWKQKEKQDLVKIQVEIEDRIGLFADILNIFSAMRINVNSINTKNTKNKLYIVFEIEDRESLPKLIPQIKAVKNVIEVKTEQD